MYLLLICLPSTIAYHGYSWIKVAERMLTGIICSDLPCHLFTSYERALDGKLNRCLWSRLSVLNRHLRLLIHLVETIIAIFWYKFVFQTTNSLDMISMPWNTYKSNQCLWSVSVWIYLVLVCLNNTPWYGT